MNALLTTALVFAMALPVGAARSQKPDEAKAEIDRIRGEMKDALGEVTALDRSDRALAMSNQAQIDTTKMLKDIKNKVERVDMPALKEQDRLWSIKRQQYIDSGCPPQGGEMPPEVVKKCEPVRIALNAELSKIVADAEDLAKKLVFVDEGNAAVTATTLANVKKQKDNAARRYELETLQRTLEASLRRQYAARITASMKDLEKRAKAAQACTAIPDLEEAACCHQVVSDGRNPRQCNVPLIYEYFERGGAFQTPVVRGRGGVQP